VTYLGSVPYVYTMDLTAMCRRYGMLYCFDHAIVIGWQRPSLRDLIDFFPKLPRELLEIGTLPGDAVTTDEIVGRAWQALVIGQDVIAEAALRWDRLKANPHVQLTSPSGDALVKFFVRYKDTDLVAALLTSVLAERFARDPDFS